MLIGMQALPHTLGSRRTFDSQSALLSAIVFGVGIAAIDSFGHGESPLFYLSEAVIAAIACVLLVRLGQYVYPAPPKAPAALARAA